MKFVYFILFLLWANFAFAQEVLTGDSDPIKLNIGSSVQNNGAQGKPGQKTQGSSEKTKLSFGLKEVKSVGNNSNVTQLKINTSEKAELRTAETLTKTIDNSVVSGVPNFYSLFIGIEKYQFNSSDLPNLSKPVKDATTLRNILVTNYSFSEGKSIFLKDPTRAEILKAIEDLATKISSRDNLLIFYAGHGYWDERLKIGYWLPSDSRSSEKSNWISNSTIRDYIAGIQSKHTLLITDACFSGSIFKTREVNSEINEFGISKIYQLPSRKAMTSGTLTTVPDESKFMEYLVKRLTDNTSKYLTARQLFSSLETAVLNNTNTVPQLGVIQETGDEGGDFIFFKK